MVQPGGREIMKHFTHPLMNRRQFLHLSTATLGTLPFARLYAEPLDVSPDFVKTFNEPVSRESWVALWSELLEGYSKSLSPGKAWGNILPESDRTHWLKAPKSFQGDIELVSRMQWALSGWFSQKNRPTSLKGRDGDIDAKALIIDSIAHATDPKHPEFWNLKYGGPNVKSNQYSVESPAMGLSALAANQSFPNDLPKEFNVNVAEWLRLTATNVGRSNWCLFYALAAVTREGLGGEIDEDILRKNIAATLDMYEGGGIFSDGKGRCHYDDYNYWVFSSHLGVWWELDRDRFPDLAKQIPEILRQVNHHHPFSFAADGGHPEYGRSVTYKFARLASLIQAYRLGFCDVPVGQIRKIVRLHLAHYLKNGAIDVKNQRLLQTLSQEGSPMIREYYNYPGSSYWAMMTFGELWRLADDDPFWTAPEELLPVEKSDFVHPVTVPGWKYIGVQKSGAVVLINYGSNNSKPPYVSKYQKQAYHAQLGFVVGTKKWAPCDQMPVLLIDGKPHYPRPIDWDKNLPEFARKVEVFGKNIAGVTLTHLILPVGETILRFTRVQTNDTTPHNATLHLGGYALGYSKAESSPKVIRKNKRIVAQSPRFQTILADLSGMDNDRSIKPDTPDSLKMDQVGYLGKADYHSRDSLFVLPYTEHHLTPNHTSIIAHASYGSTQAVDSGEWIKEIQVLHLDDKSVRVKVKGKVYVGEF